jgi:RNA polymerase sigma factor (TIGR02999 family)
MSDSSEPSLVTQLLEQLGQGRRDALDRLVPLVYDELRAIARRRMAQEREGHTLQATALVHEAFGRLVDQKVAFRNRAHFFGIAARCMRRVLLDHARKRDAAKRPPRAEAVDLDNALVVADTRIEEVVAINEALDGLAALDPRQAQVVEYRYFGGMTIDEIAEALSIAPATVKRDWDTAKLYLRRALKGERDDA